ncbi:hypothetical protein DICVIV_08339 [Dictyocaulus viviparus]|uniref:Uncharacterized protein n=1 Tax=Dictyocaulus viviparus TaxID=29172 RepID=A0A0D8XLS8_DICVI|nr:hypothetical protein DICVIV_08339 [Dictyocaulus viviparus]
MSVPLMKQKYHQMRDVVLAVALVFAGVGEAHVSLTFPEARYPPLDFLDTSRTMGPCGVPKQRKDF